MKEELLRIMKKIVAGIAAATLVMSGAGSIPKEVNAANSVSDEVKFVEVAYETFKTFIDNKEAPVYEGNDSTYGYLFGGWYAGANEETPLKSSDAVDENAVVYAKYVPAYVMGVKCQNDSQTTKNTKTSMRVVSSIDSVMYSEVGMVVKRVTLNNGNCTKVTTVSNSAAKAYRGNFSIYDSEGNRVANYTPKQVFGAESEYFTAVSLINISNYDMLICVQPYWITLDGTRVEGLSRYARVNDGVEGYVSIPINLKSATDVAAGLITVDYSSLAKDGYRLYAVEGGIVFGEMANKVDESNCMVKCVGNVNDIRANAKSDDIFVSLRFAVPSGGSRTYAEDMFYNLTVDTAEFTDIAESTLDGYRVWSVQY